MNLFGWVIVKTRKMLKGDYANNRKSAGIISCELISIHYHQAVDNLDWDDRQEI